MPPASSPPAIERPAVERPVADLPLLTGLRFPVALWVVLYHAEKLVVGEGGYIPVIHHGYLGVDVFFLISGFILAHVYRQRFARGEPGLYRHFVWLRFARVWPAYAAVLLIAAAVGILRARWGSGTMQIEPLPYLWEFLRHLAMLQSWGLADFEAFNQPGWSLSAEWAAYLSFPLFLFAANLARTNAARVLAIALSFALLWLVYRQAGFTDLNQAGGPGMMRLAVEFLSGILLCALAPVPGRDGRAGDIAVIAGIAGTAIVLPTLGQRLPLGDVLALPFFALLVWGAAASGPIARRILANRAILFLGAASYSIYLVQSPAAAPIVAIGKVLGLTTLAAWPQIAALMSIAAALVAGIAVYLLVEQPARAFLRRGRGGATKRPPVEPAAGGRPRAG